MGIVNLKQIDYGQFIWDDMVHHIQRGYNKIPFVRFTKLLIDHFLDTYDDIPKRLDDEDIHTAKQEHAVTMIKVQSSSTRKQGKRLPDFLLTESVQATKAYKQYDIAFQVKCIRLVKIKRIDPLRSRQEAKGAIRLGDRVALLRRSNLQHPKYKRDILR